MPAHGTNRDRVALFFIIVNKTGRFHCIYCLTLLNALVKLTLDMYYGK